MKDIYIFDFDGVIADPVTHEVSEEVLERVAQLMMSGHYVAFNTGRGIAWFEEFVVPGISGAGVTRADFDKLVIVTEKGGEYTEFIDGNARTTVSESRISQSARDKATAVFESMPDAHASMGIYQGKQTMLTIAKHAGVTMEEYLKHKFKLEDAIIRALEGEEAVLDSSINAVDIQAPGASKYGGTKLIYEWLKRRVDVMKCTFIILGDSKSDYDMPRFIADHGGEVSFVFTGETLEGIEIDPVINIIRPGGLYIQATLAYFRSRL